MKHMASKKTLLPAMGALIALPIGSLQANDGRRAPTLPTGTVTLRTERVLITIGRSQIRIDSRAELVNRGPACTVGVGLPDQTGVHRRDFALSVDGRAVKPAVATGTNPNEIWHSLPLTFEAGGHHQLHTVYTLPVVAQTAVDGRYYQLFYALNHGDTWQAPIERTEVEVRFDRPSLRSRLCLRPHELFGERFMSNLPWSHLRAGTVIFNGPAHPDLKSNTLHFTRTNWRPTPDDDLALFWKE